MKRQLKGMAIPCLAIGILIISPVLSYAGTWQQDQRGWRYQNDNNTYQTGQWFQDINGIWYHFDENGYMQTNWNQINGEWYYFSETGAMLADTTTPDGYQVDNTGAMVDKANYNIKSGWQSDSTGWWYQLSNGSYVKENWKTIEGKKYYFDDSGYMVTGFYEVDGQYYYFDQSGVLIKKNFVLDDIRYFVDESGAIFDTEEIGFGDSYWWGENRDSNDSGQSGDDKNTGTQSDGYEDGKNTGTRSDGYEDGYAVQVIDFVNKERKKAGKNELKQNDVLMEAAGIRAEEIVELMEHERPDGSSWISVYEELDIDYHSAGENIAGGQISPDSVMDAWMNSAPHKKNILGDFKEIGVGCYVSNGRFYWVQLFLKN